MLSRQQPAALDMPGSNRISKEWRGHWTFQRISLAWLVASLRCPIGDVDAAHRSLGAETPKTEAALPTKICLTYDLEFSSRGLSCRLGLS